MRPKAKMREDDLVDHVNHTVRGLDVDVGNSRFFSLRVPLPDLVSHSTTSIAQSHGNPIEHGLYAVACQVIGIYLYVDDVRQEDFVQDKMTRFTKDEVVDDNVMRNVDVETFEVLHNLRSAGVKIITNGLPVQLVQGIVRRGEQGEFSFWSDQKVSLAVAGYPWDDRRVEVDEPVPFIGWNDPWDVMEIAHIDQDVVVQNIKDRGSSCDRGT